ncbi:MAG: carboxypeptidase-like regulatory domain-containing protein, partial [Chloroflexota bacterium]|nr:carboxypeptidase-like regulatory domain-containing protein [Chloroflexota bacterium]
MTFSAAKGIQRTRAVRALTYAAASLVVAFSAGAQEVRVEVVRHADGEPIPGALVAVVSEQSTPIGRFSGGDGRATLSPPRRGGYRVRVEKVGYDVWTSALLVAAERPTRVRAGMKARSLRLPPLTGSTETRCSTLGEQASVVGDMWGEIRKALTANSVTEAQGLAPLDIDTYDRVVDANGTVVSNRSERRRANGMRPFNVIESSLPGSPATPAPTFSVPEASTLLSDRFIASHCFTGIRGTGPETGLLGL